MNHAAYAALAIIGFVAVGLFMAGIYFSACHIAQRRFRDASTRAGLSRINQNAPDQRANGLGGLSHTDGVKRG